MTGAQAIALLIGVFVGFFVVVGSSMIIRSMIKIMEDKTTTANWSPGQAVGLASLWTAKMFAACVALYIAQRVGYSTTLLGVGLLPGIALGVYVSRQLK